MADSSPADKGDEETRGLVDAATMRPRCPRRPGFAFSNRSTGSIRTASAPGWRTPPGVKPTTCGPASVLRPDKRLRRHETLLASEDRRQLSPRAMRKARSKVKGLPAGFRPHDLFRSDVEVELELPAVAQVHRDTPLSWDFTVRWLVSFGGVDQHQPEQRRNRVSGLVRPDCQAWATAWCSLPMTGELAPLWCLGPGGFVRLVASTV
jgi:hypothetical protein